MNKVEFWNNFRYWNTKGGIVGDFPINIGNTVRKFYSNFEKIFEIFWSDFVDVSRMKSFEKFKNFLEKLRWKFWIDVGKIIEKLWRNNGVFLILVLLRLWRKFENISLKFCWNCEALKKFGEHFIQIFKDFEDFQVSFWKKVCEKLSKEHFEIIWEKSRET